MSIHYPKLQRMFDNDSKLMLETLRRILSRIEPGELDRSDVERASRAAHSIKSEAGFLNQDGIATVAHRLEDALIVVRDGGGEVARETALDLRDGFAALELSVKAYRKQRHQSVPEQAVTPDSEVTPEGQEAGATTAIDRPSQNDSPADEEALASGGAQSSRMSEAEQGMLREASRRGERLFRVVIALNGSELGYARAFLVVNNLELSCAVIRTDPPLDSLAETGADRITAFVTTGVDEEVIRRAVHVDEVELVELTEIGMGEVGRASQATEEDRVRPVRDVGPEESALLAAEIARLASQLSADDANDPSTLAETSERIRGFATALADRARMDSRVEFVDSLRELCDRSIRYAKRQGKYVRISVGGSGASVSPAVANTLLEALLHLIRNSIDHGIEPIEARAKKGRHPAATIAIRVDAIGEKVRVVVQDDGNGIDESAVRKNGESENLIDILARSGLSTRDSADERSGRGMGLTTVVHSVRNLLGGDIELRNNPGRGATFILLVPTASRVMRVLIVRSGTKLAAIPRATILATHEIDLRRVRKDSFGAFYYDVGGSIVPLTLLNGMSPSERRLTRDLICLHARGAGVERVLLVDAVDGEESVVQGGSHTGGVHSRVLGREIEYIYPGRLNS